MSKWKIFRLAVLGLSFSGGLGLTPYVGSAELPMNISAISVLDALMLGAASFLICLVLSIFVVALNIFNPFSRGRVFSRPTLSTSLIGIGPFGAIIFFGSIFLATGTGLLLGLAVRGEFNVFPLSVLGYGGGLVAGALLAMKLFSSRIAPAGPGNPGTPPPVAGDPVATETFVPMPATLGPKAVRSCLVFAAIPTVPVGVMICCAIIVNIRNGFDLSALQMKIINTVVFLFALVLWFGVIFTLIFVAAFISGNVAVLLGRRAHGLRILGRGTAAPALALADPELHAVRSRLRVAGLGLLGFVPCYGLAASFCGSSDLCYTILIWVPALFFGTILAGGDLRAARAFGRFVAFAVTFEAGTLLLTPLFQPLSLTSARYASHPVDGIVGIMLVGALAWILATLRRTTVVRALSAAGLRTRMPAVAGIFGLALAGFFGWYIQLLNGSAEAGRAIEIAKARVAGDHQFYVTSESRPFSQQGLGTRHHLVVTAWNARGLIDVPVEWYDQVEDPAR